MVPDAHAVPLPRDGPAHHVRGAAMTRRDPNAPNPYHLLAQLREEEMVERARLAARGMAVLAPLHTPSPHLVTAGEEVGGCAPCCECPCHSWLTYQGEHDDTCGWREP